MNIKAPERIYYMDYIRGLASILGIFYHSSLVFCSPWAINIDSSLFSKYLYIPSRFLSCFRMPLFLFMSGFFAMYSIRKYNLAGFLKGRIRRILLPLLSSIVILLPLQMAFRLKYIYGNKWLDHFFTQISPFETSFTLSYLWFLHYIFVFSFLLVSIMLLSKKSFLNKRINEWLSFFHTNLYKLFSFWFLLNILLIIISSEYTKYFPYHKVWFPIIDMAEYLPMFLFGSYCYANAEYIYDTMNIKLRYIILLLLFFLLLFIMNVLLTDVISHWRYVFQSSYEILLMWLSTLSVIIFIKKLLDKKIKIANYLAQASYPVYLFHHPIIIIVSYYFLKTQLKTSVYTGYTIVCFTSLIFTYAAYELLIKRNNIGAFIFSGKNLKKITVKGI
jgi:glucans biosynthesis protein C